MITVRDCLESDLGAVAELEAGNILEPWSLKVLNDWLKLDRVTMVIAELDGEIVGYGSYEKVLDEAQVGNICVSNRARRVGIASMIMTTLEIRARDLGCRVMLLEAAVGNVAALGLYEKLGYATLNIRKKYYKNRVDAKIMQKQL